MKLYLPDPSFTSHIWKTLHIWNGWIESLLAPCGHLAITDTPLTNSWWIPGEDYGHLTETNSSYYRLSLVIRDLRTPLSVPTAQFYCSNSRYNGHQSASFDILAELFQIIIYLFLFFSSSLSLRLKSEQSDSRLTWSFRETTVLTCKK